MTSKNKWSHIKLKNTNNETIVFVGQLQENTEVMLYELQGRLVATSLLESTLTKQAIDVSHLSAGLYVIQLNNDAQQKNQKVIIK